MARRDDRAEHTRARPASPFILELAPQFSSRPATARGRDARAASPHLPWICELGRLVEGDVLSLRPTAFLRGSTTDVAVRRHSDSPGGKSPPTTAYEYGGQPLPGFPTFHPMDIRLTDRPRGVKYDASVYPPAPALRGRNAATTPQGSNEKRGARGRTSEARPHVHRLAGVRTDRSGDCGSARAHDHESRNGLVLPVQPSRSEDTKALTEGG